MQVKYYQNAAPVENWFSSVLTAIVTAIRQEIRINILYKPTCAKKAAVSSCWVLWLIIYTLIVDNSTCINSDVYEVCIK